MQLWNTLNKEELETKMRELGQQFVTISFYQYANIVVPQLFRDHLFKCGLNTISLEECM